MQMGHHILEKDAFGESVFRILTVLYLGLDGEIRFFYLEEVLVIAVLGRFVGRPFV